VAINPDHERELRIIQDQAVANCIEEMTAAGDLSLQSKEERGDRFWLTKMATQSMTIAAKIEGYIMLRARATCGNGNDDDEDGQERAVDRMIKQARGEVTAIIERARKGYRPRERGDE